MKRLLTPYLLCWFCMGSSYALTTDTSKEALLAQQVVVDINHYRIAHGRSPLKTNVMLARIATQHSLDMAHNRVPFGHDGFLQRMSLIHDGLGPSLAGAENVAFNYKTAKVVVDGWVHSAGHLRNLMGRYTRTGVGIARDSAGRLYYTQIFTT